MAGYGEAFMAPQIQMQQLANLEMQPRHIAAQSRLAEAQAGKLEEESRAQARMGAVLSRLGTPTSVGQAAPDMALQFEQIASAALASNLPEQARKLADTAAQLRVRQSTIAKNNLLGEAALTTAALNQLKVLQEDLGWVRNQDDLNTFNAQFAARTGRLSPLAGKMFSPALIQTQMDNLLASEGKITTAMRGRIQADREATSASTRAYQDFRKKYLSGKADREERRLEAAGKVGAKEVAAPTEGQLKTASALIRSDFKDLPAEESRLAANFVASRARALAKANPGLDWTMALNQAYQEAKTNGDISTESTWFGLGTKNAFKPVGMTPQAALPMEADSSKRRIGRYYSAPNGSVYQWQRGGWKPVALPPAAGGGADPEPDADADEEE